MRYEGSVYRPPSEASSLILQITVGCSHNLCTFCGMYKGEQFRIRAMEDIMADLRNARKFYSNVERIFLADGDALVLQYEHLLEILEAIGTLFPECKRVGLYGSPQNVQRKTDKQLAGLRLNGVGIIYIGAESGSDKILNKIKKGSTAEQLIGAVRKIEDSGIKASVTFISGLGGKDDWREHGIKTGKMISRMEPSYAGLLTLMVEQGTELYDDIIKGRFTLLSPAETIDETELLLMNVDVTRSCIFRSNHASNYLSLKGNLPEDKDALLKRIRSAKAHPSLLKEERFRLL
jgi:radical SAM superfamily enzyme YgiQ (UPF0313 family)